MVARKIRVVQGSLTEGTHDVLINASNTNLDLGSGVSGAIRQACGAGYQAYLHRELAPPGNLWVKPTCNGPAT